MIGTRDSGGMKRKLDEAVENPEDSNSSKKTKIEVNQLSGSLNESGSSWSFYNNSFNNSVASLYESGSSSSLSDTSFTRSKNSFVGSPYFNPLANNNIPSSPPITDKPEEKLLNLQITFNQLPPAKLLNPLDSPSLYSLAIAPRHIETGAELSYIKGYNLYQENLVRLLEDYSLLSSPLPPPVNPQYQVDYPYKEEAYRKALLRKASYFWRAEARTHLLIGKKDGKIYEVKFTALLSEQSKDKNRVVLVKNSMKESKVVNSKSFKASRETFFDAENKPYQKEIYNSIYYVAEKLDYVNDKSPYFFLTGTGFCGHSFISLNPKRVSDYLGELIIKNGDLLAVNTNSGTAHGFAVTKEKTPDECEMKGNSNFKEVKEFFEGVNLNVSKTLYIFINEANYSNMTYIQEAYLKYLDSLEKKFNIYNEAFSKYPTLKERFYEKLHKEIEKNYVDISNKFQELCDGAVHSTKNDASAVEATIIVLINNLNKQIEHNNLIKTFEDDLSFFIESEKVESNNRVLFNTMIYGTKDIPGLYEPISSFIAEIDQEISSYQEILKPENKEYVLAMPEFNHLELLQKHFLSLKLLQGSIEETIRKRIEKESLTLSSQMTRQEIESRAMILVKLIQSDIEHFKKLSGHPEIGPGLRYITWIQKINSLIDHQININLKEQSLIDLEDTKAKLIAETDIFEQAKGLEQLYQKMNQMGYLTYLALSTELQDARLRYHNLIAEVRVWLFAIKSHVETTASPKKNGTVTPAIYLPVPLPAVPKAPLQNTERLSPDKNQRSLSRSPKK